MLGKERAAHQGLFNSDLAELQELLEELIASKLMKPTSHNRVTNMWLDKFSLIFLFTSSRLRKYFYTVSNTSTICEPIAVTSWFYLRGIRSDLLTATPLHHNHWWHLFFHSTSAVWHHPVQSMQGVFDSISNFSVYFSNFYALLNIVCLVCLASDVLILFNFTYKLASFSCTPLGSSMTMNINQKNSSVVQH